MEIQDQLDPLEVEVVEEILDIQGLKDHKE
jgi:hypothetical protein